MLIQALQGLLDGNGPDFVQGGDGSSSEQPSFLPFFFFVNCGRKALSNFLR